jgi:hypothetical protein
MSTLVFLRKFTIRFVLGLAVLATPNTLLASDDHDDDGDHRGHGNGGGKNHFNIQLTDDALSELTALLSAMNFESSCSNNPAATLTEAAAAG